MAAPPPGTSETLLARLGDPGFTPGVKDVPGLLELWEGAGLDPAALRERRKSVQKTLARGDIGVARRLLGDVFECPGEQRALRIRVLARIATRAEIDDFPEILLSALRDETPRVVREAARAVAKLEGLDGARYEAALLSACRDAALPERKAAVDALGRLGGEEARTALERMDRENADLARRIDQAITLIERRLGRDDAGAVVGSAKLPQPVEVWLRCRAGAAVVVADQAAAMLGAPSVQVRGHPAVAVRWSGSLDELYRVRTAIDVALAFELAGGDSVVDRTVTTLQQPRLVEALTAWTQGAVRFRLAFAAGGRRRAAIKAVAQRLTRLGSPLVNDSRAAAWLIEVDEARARLVCVPRGADKRFSYRHTDVPAGSHPSLAALLAWLGKPRSGERVWDPFCGSGSELIECAMLEPGLHLWGTDLDPAALASAKRNFAAARVAVGSVRWDQVDAREAAPPRDAAPVSLILTNPPMGRRLGRDGSLRPLLGGFVRHAARMLGPGGRLIWVTPLPKFTAEAGRSAGLRVDRITDFDMGGFEVVVQHMRKGS